MVCGLVSLFVLICIGGGLWSQDGHPVLQRLSILVCCEGRCQMVHLWSGQYPWTKLSPTRGYNLEGGLPRNKGLVTGEHGVGEAVAESCDTDENHPQGEEVCVFSRLILIGQPLDKYNQL